MSENLKLVTNDFGSGIIRSLDKASIRAFVAKHADLLAGTVLDFGAGLSPYRDLCTGNYQPHNIAHPSTPPDAVISGESDYLKYLHYDAILCTQVLQYIPHVARLLNSFRSLLKPNSGNLIMTYATTWAEVEHADMWRFTRAGMEELLSRAMYRVVDHELRLSLVLSDFTIPIGYGVVAQPIG